MRLFVCKSCDQLVFIKFTYVRCGMVQSFVCGKWNVMCKYTTGIIFKIGTSKQAYWTSGILLCMEHTY